MKIVKIVLLGAGAFLLLAIVAFFAAVLMIPDERSFTNEIEIDASSDELWGVVNDRGKYTEWQPNLSRVETIDEMNWIEYPRDSAGPLKFTLGKDDRPRSMAFEYQMGDVFVGSWQGYATPTNTGVRLETRDRVVTKGWVTKIMVYLFFDLDRFAEEWNNRLKERVEKLRNKV